MKIGLLIGSNKLPLTYQLGVLEAIIDENIFKHITHISTSGQSSLLASLLICKKNRKKLKLILSNLLKVHYFNQTDNLVTKNKTLYNKELLLNEIKKYINPKDFYHAKIKAYLTTIDSFNVQTLVHQIYTDSYQQKVYLLNNEDDIFSLLLASLGKSINYFEDNSEQKTITNPRIINDYPITPLIDEQVDIVLVIGNKTDLNPNLYDEKTINFVFFSPKEENLYKKIDNYYIINNRHYLDGHHKAGYLSAKLVINQMKEEKLIKQVFSFTKFKKKDQFYVLN